MSPSHLAIGHSVTFSGTGCAHPNVVQVSIDAGSTTEGTRATADPGADQTWSRTVIVADSTVPGARTARAACYPRSLVRPLFAYPPVTVNVTTFRRLQVSPGTTVHAGATLEVRPVGRCAQPRGASVDVTFERPRGHGGANEPVYGESTRDAVGNWSGHVTIPANTPPGAYEVAAACVLSRVFTAFYPAVPLVVLPEP